MADLASLASLDSAFWRRAARFGARGPTWFARYSPPVIGVAICAFASDHRRVIASNLKRVRGPCSPLRDSVDVARTFATYASCLAEVLAGDVPGEEPARAFVLGEGHVDAALADGRGIIFATAHTAGWEAVGRLVWPDKGLKVMIVETPERDAAARAIQDEARRAIGVVVTHVGSDPFSALPLVRHLREGGAVALQVDRCPAGLRGRAVRMFGEDARIPEGPLRLSALTEAPIVPLFTGRIGHRRYKIVAYPSIRIGRHADEVAFDAGAQQLADAIQDFVRSHPTQWFHFVT
ncbi:MAG TPA: lysophospholipid acyltransferase family protein [Polyangiaceae bacterium]|nr:lysophospholipid acyltransferase family protein [Polyangiaceae bacterium]